MRSPLTWPFSVSSVCQSSRGVTLHCNSGERQWQILSCGCRSYGARPMKYVVQTAVVGICHVEVEADNEEEARERAVEVTTLADVESWEYVPGYFVEDDALLSTGA